VLLIQRKRFPIRVHIVDSFGNLAGRSGDRYRNWNRREGNFWRSVPLIHESRVTAFTTARAFSLSWARTPAGMGCYGRVLAHDDPRAACRGTGVVTEVIYRAAPLTADRDPRESDGSQM